MIKEKAFTIKIKPKTPKTKVVTTEFARCENEASSVYHIQEIEEIKEREAERREEGRCDEIQSLRCEIETMKAAMDEMRQHMNEMRLQLQAQPGCLSHSQDDGRRVCDVMNEGGKFAASDFGEWVNGVELTREDLDTMFECIDVVEWASKFIVADLKRRSGPPPYPLCAIKGAGSRNELLTYHGGAWKKITDQEFASTIVNKMFKKMLATFTAWKNENYNRILTSEHFSTLYHSNYARILSFNENASKLKTKLFHAL